MREDDEHLSRSKTDPTRLLALTDGVFAIIMTLLVLELKVPDMSNNALLGPQLKIIGFKFLLYFASFLLAGVYWVSHRMMFILVKHVNNTLLWSNVVFLMICSLIPFGAALLGSYPDSTGSLIIYGILLAALAGFRLWMYYYITSHIELLHAPVPEKRKKRVMQVMIFAPIMFVVSLCLVEFFPTFSLVLYCVTPPMFVVLIKLANQTPA